MHYKNYLTMDASNEEVRDHKIRSTCRTNMTFLLNRIAVFDGQHPRDASKSSDSKGDAVVPL